MDIDVPFYSLCAAGSFLGFMSLVYLYSRVTRPTVDYRGKHVLITGGSMGIGYAIAEKFLARGANVTIAARNATVLEEAAERLRAHCIHESQQVNAVAIDVGSGMEPVQKAFDTAVRKLGFVHTLVNNAGIYFSREFDKITQAEFETLLRVNLLGSVYATRAVLDGMKAHRQGRIIFVSSQAAQVGFFSYSAYAAAKWAIRGFAEALQMEVKPYGVLVSVAYPPDTDTPGYRAEMMDKPEITKILTESAVHEPESVAYNIVEYGTSGYYSVSTGLDGWMLNQLHAGMSPVNNYWEVFQQIVFSGLLRVISASYTSGWDSMIAETQRDEVEATSTRLLAELSVADKTTTPLATPKKEQRSSRKVKDA